MARDKLTEYSATASENTVCGDVNIAENSALPSDLNNFAREVMSHLKAFSDGTDAIDALDVTGAATIGGAFTSQGIDDNATSTAMTLDSSGNVLVGKTAAGTGTVGVEARSDGLLAATRDGNQALLVNRKTSDGNIALFQRDGFSVGGIGTNGGDRLSIGSGDTGLDFEASTDAIRPCAGTGSGRDNAIDLGRPDVRFDDIYATNGTIQTSDQNEKNTITDSDLGLDFINRLSPKSYIFNGKTRTHYGLIAQEVETVLGDISKPTSGFAGFIKSDISDEQDGSEYRYGLRYTQFVGPLIQAIKDLKAENDAMRARLDALEAN